MASPALTHREPNQERAVWILISGLIGLCVLALIGPVLASSDDASTEVESAATDAELAAEAEAAAAAVSAPEQFTISASGDILIHGRVGEAAATDDGWDFRPLFANVKPLIEAADFAICHLEVPISSTNDDLAFGGSADGGVFRSPTQLADAVADAGFDSCSVASNHAWDSGEASVISTVAELKRVGLPHTGIATTTAEANQLWRFDVLGTIVGHLSYTYGLNGRADGEVPQDRVAQIDEAQILADAARHTEAGVEFVVVSMHWGDEFTTELNPLQADLGPRLLASPDIDLIIGHHAHVPQQIVEIDGEYIAYGLGNLLSNQSSSAPECPTACPLESQDGALVDFVVGRRDDGSLGVVRVDAHPTWVDVGGTWQIIDTGTAPVTGAVVDPTLLQGSAERTLATLNVPAAG
jgi:poly-gamma-glutamate synthesis protein (capsule biosynthesis protein)